ncbi:MAG: glycosyltransferase family 2 protein [Thermodesulfobacteriota bacterium]
MRPSQFDVSVIIPVYNGGPFLADAIENIKQQSYVPLEIIIVDDGSTDATARIASNTRGDVCYVYQPNSGTPSARNKGLKRARGNVIAFLDVDDLWKENKLEIQLALLSKDPSVEVVLGYLQYIRSSELGGGKTKLERFTDPWLELNLGAAICLKSAFDKVGFFDEQLPYCDDIDWFMRAKELGISMLIHKEITLYHRRHEHNITNQRNLNHSYFVKAIKKSLERRRKSGEGVVEPLSKWIESYD